MGAQAAQASASSDQRTHSPTPQPDRYVGRVNRNDAIATALLLPGAVALAAGPAGWLVQTWGHNTTGWVVALVVVLLAVRSVLSGPSTGSPRGALALLAVAITLRLFARLLQIEVIGALVLAIDVLALARLLGLGSRPRSVNPLWLAALFCFSLPIEALVVRLLGWPLRMTAASAAAWLLDAEQVGTLVRAEGITLAVELPCSGAQGLALFVAFTLVLLALRRGPPVKALAAAVGGALVANILRLMFLHRGLMMHLPVMEEPWHSLIGLVCMAVSVVPLLAMAVGWPDHPRAPVAPADPVPLPVVAAVSGVAVMAALLPTPELSTPPLPDVALPASMDAWIGEPLPLLPGEDDFFARTGSTVEKRAYSDPLRGPYVVLMARTAQPLRMHDPTICLTGAGWTLTPVGQRNEPVLSALWHGEAPDGSQHLVAVSFVSADATASSVSEMIWRWLPRPSTPWILVERILPWSECGEHGCVDFDRQLFIALEV